MADQWDNDDANGNDGGGGQQNNGGGLRKQLEQALARLKTLEGENETLKTQTRQATISDLLKEKKYDAKVAKLIPKDVAPTAEAVKAWLDEYGDIFNIKQDDDAGSESGASTGGQGSAAGAEDFEAQQEYIHTMRQMGSINGGMLPPEKVSELMGKINDPAATKDSLIALINAHGGGVGMG